MTTAYVYFPMKPFPRVLNADRQNQRNSYEFVGIYVTVEIQFYGVLENVQPSLMIFLSLVRNVLRPDSARGTRR